MGTIRKMILAFGALMLSISANAMEKGVALALAEQRVKAISDVKYDLKFTIPEDRRKDVVCHEKIGFEYKANADLVLDFQGLKKQFDLKCVVNGKKIKAEFRDEHIIIDNKYLHKGHNEISLKVLCGEKSLNRSGDYLYTLFVPDHARSVFACFDQPDMKATFTLELTMPSKWTAISNAQQTTEVVSQEKNKSLKTVAFKPTELLPTYLFSFTAGKFERRSVTRDGRLLEALYRETDKEKIAQMNDIFDEVALSLRWLEGYTNMKQPFSKYGFVILPNYQFGGMEHPGAIQFSDRTMFLGKNPAPNDKLKRMELIAHETAHLWFGDLVTMQWFNDVWTKEVFANFLAAKIVRDKFPDVDHDLNFLKAYQIPALETDRTEGTHPIQQPLSNLNKAGLLYGNIIYDKAPIMMRQLELLIGKKQLREGLREYLKTYSFGNATWDDLVTILDKHNPKVDVEDFSRVWVKEKGMPIITTTYDNNKITIKQHDPYNRGLCWKQKFTIGLLYVYLVDTTKSPNGSTYEIVEKTVNMNNNTAIVKIEKPPFAVIVNYDGYGYGQFKMPNDELTNLLCYGGLTGKNKLAGMINLYENIMMGDVNRSDGSKWLQFGLNDEKDPLISSAQLDYLFKLAKYSKDGDTRRLREYFVYMYGINASSPSTIQHLVRSMSKWVLHYNINEIWYEIWANKTENKDREEFIDNIRNLLTERDYMNMAYHLAIVMPEKWEEIIKTQRARIKDADRLREFDYISRACNPNQKVKMNLFLSLLKKENRTVEPWATKVLALLNDDWEEPMSNGYITQGLEALEEIQETGDIFFTSDWLYALLSGHCSTEAKSLVEDFIKSHPNLSTPLMNKLKEVSYYLLNKESDEEEDTFKERDLMFD